MESETISYKIGGKWIPGNEPLEKYLPYNGIDRRKSTGDRRSGIDRRNKNPKKIQKRGLQNNYSPI